MIDGNLLFQEFRGALMENYVALELKRRNYGLYYWTSEGRAELDFLIQHEDSIYPIEVKSGNSARKKSLRFYADQYQPKQLIRVSPVNLRKDGEILNCPVYLLNKLGDFLDII